MAKTLKILLFVCFCISLNYHADAQEMQISFGVDANGGLFTVKNTTYWKEGIYANSIVEDTENVFFSPGINFKLRGFQETETKISNGFVFKERILLMTNGNTEGYVNNYYASEDFSINDFFLMVMDTGFGLSSRIKLSNKIGYYTDIGFNITIMNSDNYKGDKLEYYGAGFFVDLAFQFDITKKVYFELGLSTAMSLFSSQEGVFLYNGSRIKYEDTGRKDLLMASLYLNIGWRIDMKKKMETPSQNLDVSQ